MSKIKEIKTSAFQLPVNANVDYHENELKQKFSSNFFSIFNLNNDSRIVIYFKFEMFYLALKY